MSGHGLILTYHGVEPGPPPLFIEPPDFEAHLQVLADAHAVVLSVSALARGLREGTLPRRAVAITFDDGFASVVTEALPRLRRRGWPATVYCVAGFLGETNDWPTQPAAVPRRRLASAGELVELVEAGFEIGAHTLRHPPLRQLSGDALQEELVGSQRLLEELVGTRVRTFACPYGDCAGEAARLLLQRTYDAVCGATPDTVGPATSPYRLPRIDAHYVRSPRVLGHVVAGRGSAYLTLRRSGSRARRLMSPDWRRHGSGA